jgi:hypothetical protein
MIMAQDVGVVPCNAASEDAAHAVGVTRQSACIEGRGS